MAKGQMIVTIKPSKELKSVVEELRKELSGLEKRIYKYVDKKITKIKE